MNRAATLLGMGWVARWAAVAGTAVALTFPALADMTLPPPQYDIGGVTEADTLMNYIDWFGPNGPPLIRVAYGGAKMECDRISYERYGQPYPASETADGSTLLGCLIRDLGNGNPVIVYSYDRTRTDLANQILRHEIGHLMGWPGDHRRD